MSTEKLSTGCKLSTALLKKREGEKRNPPCTPLREKGKGKEDKPCACSTGLFARAYADPHVRGALLRRHVNAAVEDALVAFCGKRGPAPSDQALWARFAWRFGYAKLVELMDRRRKKREEKRRSRAVKRVKKALGIDYANVLDAYLHQRTWRDIGIPKRTFGDRLKKVKIFFHAWK